MAIVGWWASDAALSLAQGRRFRSKWPSEQDVSVSIDHRTRHLYCIGSSGSGKSRFARRLLCEDIQANRGLTLIDAQDLQGEVLAYIAELALGPGKPTVEKIEELGDKVVLIEPANQTFGCPGINLLQVGDGQIGYQIVDGIIESIRELWSDSYGPRLEDICRHSLLLLQELGLTVTEMVPLLSDAGFRNALVSRSRNPDIRLYFNEHLGGLRPAELKMWVESSRNKWSAFLSNPLIKPIFGQSQSTINFREIIDEGKWLIVNLSRDKLKESRHLLGAVIIMLLHQAGISRENTSPQLRYFHGIFIDEFQEYWTPSVIHLLEGARKYGLALSLFHQNLTQPPFNQDPAIVDTILGNCSTLCAFNVSRKDAVRLAGEVFFTSGTETKFQETLLGIPMERATFWSIGDEKEAYAAELMKQRQAEVYIKIKGIDDEPYAARVPNVPDLVPDQEKIDILRRHVARRYYRPVAEVEREIQERWQGIRAAAPPQRMGLRDFTR